MLIKSSPCTGKNQNKYIKMKTFKELEKEYRKLHNIKQNLIKKTSTELNKVFWNKYNVDYNYKDYECLVITSKRPVLTVDDNVPNKGFELIKINNKSIFNRINISEEKADQIIDLIKHLL